MKLLSVLSTAVLATFSHAAVDLYWTECDGGEGLGSLQRLVPATLDQGTTSLSAYTLMNSDLTGGTWEFSGYVNNPLDPKGDAVAIGSAHPADICQDATIEFTFGLGKITYHSVGCPVAAGMLEVKFDVEVSTDLVDFLLGDKFQLNLNIASPSKERVSCLTMKRFPKPVFAEDESASLMVSYPAPDTCKSQGVDHYRLTMNNAGLLLIATDSHDKPLDPGAESPREFECQNKGMFDQLDGKKNCLKIDKSSHIVVSNSDDTNGDHPCAEDNDNCAWEGQSTWTFKQKWTGLDQTWCMKDVDVGGCKMSYAGADLLPTVDMKSCSPKWNVQKTFKSSPRRRRRRSLSIADAPSCSDCDGNFQCLTTSGCTSAASQEVCASLGGGLWCPSTTPSPPPPAKLGHCCPEPIHMVWLACCTEGSCCPNRDNVTLDCCRDQQTLV